MAPTPQNKSVHTDLAARSVFQTCVLRLEYSCCQRPPCWSAKPVTSSVIRKAFTSRTFLVAVRRNCGVFSTLEINYMLHPFKRIWPPRYRLKTLLLFVAIYCMGAAWISHNWREYSAEQSAIAELFSTTPTTRTHTFLADNSSKWPVENWSQRWRSERALTFT